MSVELKTAANIKYINIKMKKKLKNNSEIIYIIKDAGEVCVKILLFLLCCDNLEKIDFEFMKSNVKPDASDDDEIIKAVDFWKEKDILDYEITSIPNVKGANMDNIINIILNISRDINMMNDEEKGDLEELTTGLGIFEEKHIKNKKTKQSEIVIEAVKSKVSDEPDIPDELHEPDEPDEVEEIKEVEIIEEPKESEEPEEPYETEEIKEPEQTGEKNAPREEQVQRSSSSVSIDELSDALETKQEFRKLIHEAQLKMKTTFNTADLGIIYNLYETNKMEAGLILKLAETCAEEDKNNIRYFEKVALGNISSGILTLKQYEEVLQEIYKLIEFEEKIKKLFNTGEKKFTAKEKNYIKKWAKEFDFSDDVLSEGYNVCIKRLEKLSFEYINGVYTNWHDKGFKTINDINSEFGANADNFNNPGNKKNSGFDLQQHMEKVIKRRLEKL